MSLFENSLRAAHELGWGRAGICDLPPMTAKDAVKDGAPRVVVCPDENKGWAIRLTDRGVQRLSEAGWVELDVSVDESRNLSAL